MPLRMKRFEKICSLGSTLQQLTNKKLFNFGGKLNKMYQLLGKYNTLLAPKMSPCGIRAPGPSTEKGAK